MEVYVFSPVNFRQKHAAETQPSLTDKQEADLNWLCTGTWRNRVPSFHLCTILCHFETIINFFPHTSCEQFTKEELPSQIFLAARGGSIFSEKKRRRKEIEQSLKKYIFSAFFYPILLSYMPFFIMS